MFLIELLRKLTRHQGSGGQPCTKATDMSDFVLALPLYIRTVAAQPQQQATISCIHYESETALKGVERRWEALAPVATQRL
jgi:hypothetical protein